MFCLCSQLFVLCFWVWKDVCFFRLWCGQLFSLAIYVRSADLSLVVFMWDQLFVLCSVWVRLLVCVAICLSPATSMQGHLPFLSIFSHRGHLSAGFSFIAWPAAASFSLCVQLSLSLISFRLCVATCLYLSVYLLYVSSCLTARLFVCLCHCCHLLPLVTCCHLPLAVTYRHLLPLAVTCCHLLPAFI